jgi:ferredoxin
VSTRISVDRAACQLQGACAAHAPEIFSFDEAGELIFRSEIGAAETGVAEDAAFLCPTQAITLTTGTLTQGPH